MTEARLRAQRRRALLEELEQLRRLRERVSPRRAKRSRDLRLHQLTRLSI